MDTLRQLAGDVSEFLTNRADMVRNTPGYQPTAATGRKRLDQIANRSSEELRALYDQVWSNPAFGPLVMGIKAFHGSPHDFDKFRMDKLGTGEGAQAYGHGLYFAENEGVARGYRDALRFPRVDSPSTVTEQILDDLNYHRGNVDGVRSAYEVMIQRGDEAAQKMGREKLAELDSVVAANPGRMYEVDINTTPDRLLDWDKPLSEQPQAVRDALPSIASKDLLTDPRQAKRIEDGTLPGSAVYSAPMNYGGRSNEEVARKWRKAGIDGIQYADQGSRYNPAILPNNLIANEARLFLTNAGGDVATALRAFNESNPVEKWAGLERDEIRKVIEAAAKPLTRNYVIFDDSLINILRKYGILAPLMGAGAVEAVSGATEQ
jgi:hypothetical protein